MPISNAVNSANAEKITIVEGYKRWVRAQAEQTPTDAKYHWPLIRRGSSLGPSRVGKMSPTKGIHPRGTARVIAIGIRAHP